MTTINLITREMVADQLSAYLRHEPPADLVAWAESILMEAEMEPAHFAAIRAIARIDVVDVRAFALTWGDREQLLSQLGYSAQVSIVAR